MRKKLFILFMACAAVTLYSCTQKKTATAQVKKSSVPAAPSITYVRMERTPCFGRCPNYALEVNSDGMVKYSGYRFTPHMGVYETGIGATQAGNLLQELNRYRPDTCRNEYELPISDLAGVNYTIRFSNSETKTIRNAHFGPGFLQAFAEKLDKQLQVDDSWRILSDTAVR